MMKDNMRIGEIVRDGKRELPQLEPSR
jgi:hypothetical protein